MDRISPDRQWLRSQARRLRRDQTDAEGRLWSLLRSRRFSGYKFRRQLILGSYIADFCCIEKMLVVELDGGQHNEQTEQDSQRTTDLEARGFRVLRFWNMDVFNHTEVLLNKNGNYPGLQWVHRLEPPPSPRPSPASGRGRTLRTWVVTKNASTVGSVYSSEIGRHFRWFSVDNIPFPLLPAGEGNRFK